MRCCPGGKTYIITGRGEKCRLSLALTPWLVIAVNCIPETAPGAANGRVTQEAIDPSDSTPVAMPVLVEMQRTCSP